MKILAVAEFDPAGVLSGHRDALVAAGVDYRLAIKDSYWNGRVEYAPDMVDGDLERLREFAEQADIIQFHPAIGQPWSFMTFRPVYHDGESEGLFGLDWSKVNPKASRISYFHGSKNAAVNAKNYASYWRERKHAIWTSTLDYVHWMGAAWAPPVRPDIQVAAPLRGEDDPLVVVQAPTDMANCHTQEFLEAVRMVGCVAMVLHNKKHEDVLKTKASANAGFDHLRGSFSVNTVENCAIGLAPLVGLQPEFREFLEEEGVGSAEVLRRLFKFHTLQGFETRLRELESNWAETAMLQTMAREWCENFAPQTIANRLIKMYRSL